jgi:carboxyl-terminal processing protease
MEERRRHNPYVPLFLAVALILGVLIGSRLSFPRQEGFIQMPATTKVNQLLDYIENQYVDTVDRNELVEKMLGDMLQGLDPHSAYIPASDLKEMNESLQGNFDGIGIEFNIIRDTIRVITALSGGPSEALGIQAGDKIVKIEGKNVAGVKIKNEEVIGKLRGPSNTKVSVSIMRRGSPKVHEFTITRGKIPIYSIDVSYMVTPEIGYIKINRFSATTYDEYLDAFQKLQKKGMKKLILDLRGNPGGYLDAAVNLADEFLPIGKLIVYTEGKAHPRRDFYSTSRGDFERSELVVLIDEGSASASEIVAGAVQDNDRATIIGRRSFGKGLVQEQSEFPDGSAVRLTIARYYTPTGRSIQKPYANGVEAYYNEEADRYTHGELQTPDSIRFADSLKFTTPGGKVVYGGGGIMPDIFVPLDTAGRSMYLAEVNYNGLANLFAFQYADRERDKLKNYKSIDNFNKSFNVSDGLLNEFVEFAEKSGVRRRDEAIKRSDKLLRMQIKALIARNIWGNEGFYPVINTVDSAYVKAIDVLEHKTPARSSGRL